MFRGYSVRCFHEPADVRGSEVEYHCYWGLVGNLLGHSSTLIYYFNKITPPNIEFRQH
jgi:hypothetical protein